MNHKIRTALLFGTLVAALPASACSEAANTPSNAAPQETIETAKLDPAILKASTISPEAFVRALVRLYEDGNTPTDAMPDNQAFFSASTSALIEQYIAANDAGAFSADPFCSCQDWMSLKVTSAKTTMTDPAHATVDLTMTGDSSLTQRYLLVKEPEGWRVDDILHPEYGSMIAPLKAGG